MNEETQDLYALLRDHLRVADTPLTCHDLYDVPEIRAVAPSANRVSDYLGVLFRRGELNRVQAVGSSDGEHGRARWAYIWREKVRPEWVGLKDEQVKVYRPKPILEKPNIFITEDGGLLNIEMPEISIQIQIKKK